MDKRGGASELFISVEIVKQKQKDWKDDTHKDNTVEALLEPCHRVLLLNTVGEAHSRSSLPSPGNSDTRAAHHHVEVHTEDTNVGVVSGTKIDMLLDTEAKVASIREVLAPQLVLLHLQTTLQDLLGLGPTDGDVHSDLLVTTDTECADGEARF